MLRGGPRCKIFNALILGNRNPGRSRCRPGSVLTGRKAPALLRGRDVAPCRCERFRRLALSRHAWDGGQKFFARDGGDLDGVASVKARPRGYSPCGEGRRTSPKAMSLRRHRVLSLSGSSSQIHLTLPSPGCLPEKLFLHLFSLPDTCLPASAAVLRLLPGATRLLEHSTSS